MTLNHQFLGWERVRENLRLRVWGAWLSFGGRWRNILEAEATKTLHIVVKGLPCGVECLYAYEPVVNRKVVTPVDIAGIKNRTNLGFIYGNAIHATIGRRITPKAPATCHGLSCSELSSSSSFRKDSKDMICLDMPIATSVNAVWKRAFWVLPMQYN